MTTDAVRRLKTYGRDVSSIAVSRIPADMDKTCFICVNTYTSYRLSLGTGPLNDAVTWAKRMKAFGYEIYFMHNPHSRNFLKYLDAFLEKVKGELVVYYVGHGTSVVDRDGDESDGMDEAMVFDDGTVIDDVLVNHLCEHKHPDSKLILVTDACHSGTIWDIHNGSVNGRNLPENVISISAANDKQTAKQTVIDRQEQGIFTYNISKLLKADPELSPNQLATKMKTILRKYSQTFTVGTTTEALLTEPLFSTGEK